MKSKLKWPFNLMYEVNKEIKDEHERLPETEENAPKDLLAVIGVIVGASVVGAVVGVSKVIACKRAQNWVEAIRCFVCLTGPALPNLNDTPDDINGMAVYLDSKIVGTVFQVSYSSDSERQSVYFSPIEEDWATELQAEWNNNRLNVTFDFGEHPGVYLNHKEKES